ncbi:PREDICTED: uncharacterized protein LOC105312703 [Amphimedon queenslandica]|uniref:Uncharacterized protein n=1 Tax=Amphimedon queenslandica TaxID=400682 RepID=A0AAN0IMF6_AMPQE|nr:PREDICTED: uncharacterized protein LOC105312703 [Amphimedon queenslandica]|eukprot:XP_011403860.1 PREDICTED: uncharacterized protein LOC105312703 [Amphimedon queenslandica]
MAAAPRKRPYPFEEYIPVQSKVHVGIKEAADEDEMERVYAHTRALLFKGANPQASQKTLESIGGMNGLVDGLNEENNPPPPPPPCFNPCPHHPFFDSIQCTDCEKRVCITNCSRSCCVCGQIFCQYCSVLK